jgi:colanic acid/amylovoran biosynthesis glycosyltransferase
MNMQTYDLSVITVCKNAKHNIQSTIESVKTARAALKIEHIVIDGLSTDGTKNILEELSLSKSIDVFISEQDNGIYDAMNKGVKISSGKIVYFLNSGDKLYDSKTLELAINAFDQNPNINFIYFDHIGINSDGSTGYSKKPTKLSIEYFNKTNICHQAIFYRKECFTRIGFFDTSYRFLADFDWNLRAFFQHNIKAAYIPYPACFFDNCGIHTHDKFQEIVQEERHRALRCNTAGKEHASFNVITLPTTSTSAIASPQGTTRANKRVVFVAYGPNQLNGPNVWLQRFLPNIANRGFTPEVIFLLNKDTDCEVIRNLQSNNITCHSLRLSQYTEQNIINILQVIKDRSPDFFVPNLSVPAYFAARWVKSAGIPTVGVIHSDDTFHHEIMDTFISGDLGYALSGAVCVSKFLHSIAQQNNGHGIPLLTSPCGVPLGNNIPSPPGNELRFIYTGRLIQRQKRIFDVITACDVTSQKIEGTYYSFYGEDREKGQAIASIHTCHNRKFLKYGGKLPHQEIYPTLSEHHAFILLSDYEGMSISLMEAMACGLVPICLRTKSGSVEIIRHNENGLLVDNRGPDFLKAVYRLKNEKGLWEKLSKGARKTIEKEYSIDICADRWADFLHSLSETSGGKNQIHIPAPHEINLPPVKQTDNGMCREDKRMPRVQPTETPQPAQHDNFLNPQLGPDFVDLYIVRKGIKNSLDSHLADFHGTMLDVGCGQMPYRDYILASQPLVKKYIGLDFAQGKYADLRQPDLTWDGTTIPLPDASVDCAMATEVLEHCPDPLLVLKKSNESSNLWRQFLFHHPIFVAHP